MSTELDFAQEAIAALLSRDEGPAAWNALERDDWLEIGPEDGTWSQVDIAAGALEEIARVGSDVQLAPHLAAAALLAADPRSPELTGTLGLLTDVSESDGVIRARAWADADAGSLIGLIDDDRLIVEAGAASRREDELLGPVGVHWVQFARSAAHVRALPARGVAERHQAMTAYLLAVEAAAAMQDATRRAIAYLKDRRQFGAPLATRQALQHRAVDMYAASTSVSALVAEATAAWRRGDPAIIPSWAAKVCVARRGVWTLENAIQLHGGIGFTWELGLHLGLRRAQRARQLLGGPGVSSATLLAAWTDALRETGPEVIDWAQIPGDQRSAGSAGARF